MDGTPDLKCRVAQMLDQLWAVDVGKRFMKELDETPHRITLKEGTSFSCRATGEGQFPEFSRAMRQSDYATAGAEFKYAFNHSPFKGKKSIILCKQLATTVPVVLSHAFTPKQLSPYSKANQAINVGTGNKVAHAFNPNLGYGEGLEEVANTAQVDSAARAWAALLVGLIKGDKDAGRQLSQDRPNRALMMCMYQYLKPGPGIPVTVTVSDSVDSACSLDKTRTKRPYALGLAHELVHAYYAVTGTRTFPEGTQEDEAVTTGLPPFHYAKYSENLFRANWPKSEGGERVGLRLFYDFDKVTCWNCGKSYPYYSPKKVTKKRFGRSSKSSWVDIPNVNCANCGEGLPNPDRVKGLASIDL